MSRNLETIFLCNIFNKNEILMTKLELQKEWIMIFVDFIDV